MQELILHDSHGGHGENVKVISKYIIFVGLIMSDLTLRYSSVVIAGSCSAKINLP